MSIDLESMSRPLSAGRAGGAPAFRLHVSADLDSTLKDRLEGLPCLTLLQISTSNSSSIRQETTGAVNIRLVDARSGDALTVNRSLLADENRLPDYPLLILVNPAKTEPGFLERLDVPDNRRYGSG